MVGQPFKSLIRFMELAKIVVKHSRYIYRIIDKERLAKLIKRTEACLEKD
jgi:hypothetical protein